MGVAMKVKSCCCGCSLETGTLIILWLHVLGGISVFCKYIFGVSSGGVGGMGPGGYVFSAIVAGIALYGISQKRPSFIMPYLIVQGIGIVLCIIAVILFIFALFFAGSMANSIAESWNTQNSQSTYPSSKHGTIDPDAAAGAVTMVIIIIVILLLIVIATEYYLTIVVYSFYCQLKDEVLRGTGAVIGGPGYMQPAEHGQMGYNPQAYGQQPPPGYAPSYGQPGYPQQPAAVYPPKN